MASKAILVTGASTGIGRATALRLDRAGHRVFAGVRKPEDGERLAADASERLEPVQLDVTSQADVDAAAQRIAKAPNGAGLDGLVNNAGMAISGPLEAVPLDDLRRQLEVNLLGQVAVTQAMLPMLRAARGRIVFVTSIGGLVATPFFGPYNASKFGLEAIADCLRVELRPFGVDVIAVEPGSIATDIWERGAENVRAMEEGMSAEHRRLYGEAIAAMQLAARDTGERGMPPDAAAEAIERALTAGRPKPRYLVGRDARGMLAARRLLGARGYDRVVRRRLKLP